MKIYCCITQQIKKDCRENTKKVSAQIDWRTMEVWRCPYGILIAGIWISLPEKVADKAEKLAQPFTQS